MGSESNLGHIFHGLAGARWILGRCMGADVSEARFAVFSFGE